MSVVRFGLMCIGGGALFATVMGMFILFTTLEDESGDFMMPLHVLADKSHTNRIIRQCLFYWFAGVIGTFLFLIWFIAEFT